MLILRDIDVFYGDAQALWGVSLEVGRDEIVALLGSNGAGKSTTLRTISGLLRPRKGEVWLDNVDLTKTDPAMVVAAGVSHIPEGRRLFPLMTVRENLLVGAFTAKAWMHRHETLNAVFEMFPRLRERANQTAGTLSGGEQQMAAVARGLMSRPSLLMLDEPSLGLAPKIVDMIFEVLLTISKQGITVLVVEQNVQKALEVAHRAYVMETGRIILSGSSRSLMENEQVRSAYLGL